MDAVNGTSVSDYAQMVQRASHRNTLNHVAGAHQSGEQVNVEELQASNQALRDNARETGVALHTQSLHRQAFETYANTTANNSYNNSSSDSNNNDNSNDVYTFDASSVNDALQTVQRRTLGVAAYENQLENENSQPDRPEFNNPSTQPVNVYV